MSAHPDRCTACGAPNSSDVDHCEFCGAAIVHGLGGLGLLRAGKPQLDRAFLEFKKKLREDPDDPDAHFGMAAYYVKRKLHKEAAEHLRKAAEHAPISGEVQYLQAMNYALWRGWTNMCVKQHAERAVKLNPKMKEALSLLHIYNGAARSRSARGEDHLREALRTLQKAKELAVKDHLKHIYFLSAETLERARQAENAVKMYRAARDFGLQEPKVYIRLGLLLKHLGQLKLARQNLEKAHELDPSNGAVARMLASLKARMG
ncbi:MAG: tetratricopeptide repeat protein [Elusimicrobiota bacterium]